MSFLGIDKKTFLVFGVANKKSVAWHVARLLEEEGAHVVYSVRSEERRRSLEKLRPGAEAYVCDVEHEGAIEALYEQVRSKHDGLDGFVHSIAFASYSEGMKSFEDVSRRDFLQAMQISCHSFMEAAKVFGPLMKEGASGVTISISTTRMAAENYGYMAPVKAALDSAVVFLAKSFGPKKMRFNAVAPGLLKTSASAGIPGYVDSWLFAEKATLRKEGLRTSEVANAVVFLLSPRSSGINAQSIVIDAGMSTNYFDREIVSATTKP